VVRPELGIRGELQIKSSVGSTDWVACATQPLAPWLAILSVLAFIWIERRGGTDAEPQGTKPRGRIASAVADALKLLMEAITTKGRASGRIIIFVPTLAIFAIFPWGENMIMADLNVGVLFLLAIAGINTPAVFLAGWSSNNKYALLGSMRTIAMLISYEIVQVLALLAPVLFVASMRMADIVEWQNDNVWIVVIQPLGLLAYIIAGAVEMNRSPADNAEAESEIVAGYHTEYGGIKFGFFYQGEYLAGFAIAAVMVTLYFGGWRFFGLEEWVPGWIIFLGKLYTVFFVYIWSRGTLPRLRIDQLMGFAWFLLPLTIVNVLAVGAEVLIWRENELSASEALPAIAVVNLVLGVILFVGWARFLGHGRGKQAASRALLTQEVGALHRLAG
jgi:NADH-quinone oxidoreductase subunit H